MKPTLRCSSLDRLLACPGSLTLEAIVAPREGDEGAAGSWLHFLIATRLVAEHGAAGQLQKPTEEKPKSLGFSAWIVDWCLRSVAEWLPKDWFLEVEVPMAYEFDRFILSGHLDVLGGSADGRLFKIGDWKTGYDPVDEAECNEQGLGYIVLTKRAYPEAQRIDFTLAQPRNDEDEGFQRISTVTAQNIPVEGMTGQVAPFLDGLPAVFEQRVNVALDKPMSLATGKHCRFCSASAQCPAMIQLRKKMKHEMTAAELAAIAATPNDGVLGDWAVDAKTLAGPIKDSTELLHKRLDKVESITAGCGVHVSREIQKGAYTVIDPPRFYAEVCKMIQDPAKRAGVMSFSMTRLKDTIADVLKIPKTGKATSTAESVFDGIYRPHVEQGERRLLRFR